ncbi:MAG: hemolysin family protein [Candidatus Aminicenantales bacterium]
MTTDFILYLGLGLSFLLSFLLSLFYTALISSTKINLIRLLERREKDYRLKILENYEGIKIAVSFVRIIFLIAFLIYLYGVFPRLKFWPLWLFLLSLAIYLVFFELLPRFFFSLNRKLVLSLFLPSYRLPFWLSTPLILVVRAIGARKEEKEEREVSEDEIQTFIEEAREEGIIEKEDGFLIQSVVEFGDTLVREIMTPRVDMVCIRKDATIQELKELVIKEKRSRIPVFGERVDNIEGVIIAKDLLKYTDEKHMNYPLSSLIRPVYFVPESMRVSELLKELQRRKQKLAIVVDEHGGVSGLVTMEDLVEEIVGEIRDEYDLEEIQVKKLGPYDYIVTGDEEVEEIEKLFDLDLAEDIYLTMGGFITHHLGRLPQVGEKVEIKGLMVEILDVDQKRVKKMRIKKEGKAE